MGSATRTPTRQFSILILQNLEFHKKKCHQLTQISFRSIVKVQIKSRVVTVEGPRGKLVKDLSHIAVTFGRPEQNVISIELHHGARKGVATLRTVRTIINNLMIGVTRGFKYKMRYVYAHFPINVNIEPNPETGRAIVEIRYGTLEPTFFFDMILESYRENQIKMKLELTFCY